MSEPRGTIHRPARDIPVPSTLSPEAQAVLANPPAEGFEFPALDDPKAWRTMIAAHDGAIAAMMAGRAAAAPVTVQNRDLAHCREAAGHGGFLGMAPEDQEILREVRRFADAHWGRELS